MANIISENNNGKNRMPIISLIELGDSLNIIAKDKSNSDLCNGNKQKDMHIIH